MHLQLSFKQVLSWTPFVVRVRSHERVPRRVLIPTATLSLFLLHFPQLSVCGHCLCSDNDIVVVMEHLGCLLAAYVSFVAPHDNRSKKSTNSTEYTCASVLWPITILKYQFSILEGTFRGLMSALSLPSTSFSYFSVHSEHGSCW